MTKCSLCNYPIERKVYKGKMYWSEGNNPAPLADDDSRCCDLCDCLLVIPARMGLTGMEGTQIGIQLFRQRLGAYRRNNITNKESEEE
jgi:hypothetical protein